MSVPEEADHFAGRGGLALRRRRWSGPRSTRALAIVHGIVEHSGRYRETASYFAERGYSVHAFDQRGHGESEGPRNFAPSFEFLLDDIERFLAGVRRSQPELPLVLLGHSMGGLEVATLLATRSPAVEAAVLSAPALAISESIGRSRVVIGRALARFFPRLRLESGIDPRNLCRDPEVVKAYVEDPLIDTRVSLRLATGLIDAIRDVSDRAAQVEVPVLVLHGESDLVCPITGSRLFHSGLRVPGTELRTYPQLVHEILNEPEREQVLTDIHTWVEKRVPIGAVG